MKLIMVESWINNRGKREVAEKLGYELTHGELDGLSTKEIESELAMESDNVAVVTADSRFLKFVRSDGMFTVEDVFIYRNHEFKNIKDTTQRELRDAHNLMNLYEAGAFELVAAEEQFEAKSTAQRLVKHLDEYAADYYKSITDKGK